MTWRSICVVLRSADKGRYELYLDGSLIDARSGVSMIVPGRGSAYIENGIYRNGRDGAGDLGALIDRARLGTTAESVGRLTAASRPGRSPPGPPR